MRGASGPASIVLGAALVERDAATGAQDGTRGSRRPAARHGVPGEEPAGRALPRRRARRLGARQPDAPLEHDRASCWSATCTSSARSASSASEGGVRRRKSRHRPVRPAGRHGAGCRRRATVVEPVLESRVVDHEPSVERRRALGVHRADEQLARAGTCVHAGRRDAPRVGGDPELPRRSWSRRADREVEHLERKPFADKRSAGALERRGSPADDDVGAGRGGRPSPARGTGSAGRCSGVRRTVMRS